MFRLNPLVAAISLAIASPMTVYAADTGDAPATYGLATHEVVENAPQLGELAPLDNAPINSIAADGDDNEDGVFGFPTLVQNAKSYDVNVFVSNPTAQAVTLVGWVDFDGNELFDADEANITTIPPGADNQKVKLIWPDTFGLSTEFFGPTYARFRISTDPLTANDAIGSASDGEVEDYTFEILEDTDGDEIPNVFDLDNDNDGIPDLVEGIMIDTDGDGTPNYLDVDSDNDSIPDFAEAGINANTPQDTDGDGQPDYLDLDSNNDGVDDAEGDANDSDSDGISDVIEGNLDTDGDGVVNSLDIDSDNDAIPDAIEIGSTAPNPVDTDGDLIPDYLDLDSDNDGIPDIFESNRNEIKVEELLDVNLDGSIESDLVFGVNGFVDINETQIDSGVPIYAIPDSDSDGIRDFRDTDSDNDGTNDVLESGGTDTDNNGIVDIIVDTNQNNIPDEYDYLLTGGVDTDSDGIDDSVDMDFVTGADLDNDNILDTVDLDINGDGMVDRVVSEKLNDLFSTGYLPDGDLDFMPDFRDDDAVGAAGVGSAAFNAASTAGSTTDGSTTGTGTTGGTTGGGTTSGENAMPGIVETGLSGNACSISGRSGRSGNDPMFPGLLLLSSMIMFVRRKSIGNLFKR